MTDQMQTRSRFPDIQRIRRYFEESWLDYTIVWMSREALAFHFGYWDEQTRSHAESLLNMNRVMAELIGIQDGQRILDAGCGVGGSSIWLAQHYDVDVVGINIVPRQIQRAQYYARKRGVADRVHFELQDFTRPAFPDRSFDVVWALEAIVHAPDMRVFLAEAFRLLRPGGRLGVTEGMRTHRPLPEEDERLLQRWVEGWAVPDLCTPAEWTQWASEAGFVNVQITDHSSHTRPSYEYLYRLTDRWRHVKNGLRVLGLLSDVHNRNWQSSRDQWVAFERKLWIEATLSATKPA